VPNNAILGIVQETVTLAKGDDATGYTPTVALSKRFGRAGKILHVTLREDVATNNEGTAATLIITDEEAADIDASTVAAQKVYEYTGIVLTGSATASSLTDNVAGDGGAAYSLSKDEQLKIAANITAAGGGGGDTVLYATIRAEVWR